MANPKMRYCDIPWCARSNTTMRLVPLYFFGETLQVCRSHRQIYQDNSQVLWNRLASGNFDPKEALKGR